MASVTDVAGTDTPNEGRVQWNANVNAINAETSANTATIAAVGGSIVGTTESQILTNKTLVSSYRSGTNTMTISRRDLESTALFLVVSDSGTVSDMDVSAASQYDLQILGSNGVDTYVTSNVLYVRNSEVCILNETSQVLGVKVASVTGGNVAEFGGNVIVDGNLAAGTEHAAAASAEVHLKAASPEIRVETTSTQGYLVFRDAGGTNYSFTADLTGSSEYFELRFDGTRLFRFDTDSTITLDQDVTFGKVAGSHTIVGDLEVQGTVTAAGLVATATDVIINNGPVTISGGWSFIDDGALEHDKLASMTGGYILVGSAGNVPTAVGMSGDVSLSATGAASIANDVVTLAKLKGSAIADETILGGNGSSVIAYTEDSAGDISWSRNGSQLTLMIDSGVIDNANISSGAAIDMDKTGFAVNVSGLLMNGNTLEFDASIKTDILFRYVPAGTVITYAGDLGSLSSSNLVEPITGWFYCNGATYSTGTYSDLHDAIGSAWGGAGQLPDLMGVFLRGLDPSGAVDPDVGRAVGDLQAQAFESHTHELAHNWASTLGAGGDNIGGHASPTAGYPNSQASGGDETRPVNQAVYYLIKY